MATMNQVQMRAECAQRGLITGGTNNDLRARLEKDASRGLFKGDLTKMHKKYLREGCAQLSIPSIGTEEKIITAIQKYNSFKRQYGDDEETEGGFNAGLPTPADELGRPTGGQILGTLGSHVYSKSYSEYLQRYVHNHGTTEGAVTLRFWRSHRYPDVPAKKLWPVKYYDCRIDSSDDRENQR